MLKIPYYSFTVAHKNRCKIEPRRRQGLLCDAPLFRQIAELFDLDETHPHLMVQVVPGDPRWETLLQWAAAEGIAPKFQWGLEGTDETAASSFTVVTHWAPSAKQMKESELFRISGLPWEPNDVGKVLGVDEDHLAHISATKTQLTRKLDIAFAYEYILIVTERFAKKFTQAGLVGLQLHEIQWYYQRPGFSWNEVDPINPPLGRQWLASHIELPPCITPRRYSDGLDVGCLVHEDKPGRKHAFDSEGLAPAILRFKRSEIAKLGTFDIAVTRERVHQMLEYAGPNEPMGFVPSDYWMPDVIVSKRFREWFLKSELVGRRKLLFQIVELIDD